MTFPYIDATLARSACSPNTAVCCTAKLGIIAAQANRQGGRSQQPEWLEFQNLNGSAGSLQGPLRSLRFSGAKHLKDTALLSQKGATRRSQNKDVRLDSSRLTWSRLRKHRLQPPESWNPTQGDCELRQGRPRVDKVSSRETRATFRHGLSYACFLIRQAAQTIFEPSAEAR